LLWYLNDFLKKSWRRDHYEDDLFKIDRLETRYDLPTDFNSVENVFQKIKGLNYKLEAKHDFLRGIIKNYRDYKWVDIEYEYYMTLVGLYKELELNPHIRNSILKQLLQLNSCFDSIKKKLVEYLRTIEITSNLENRRIESILLEGTEPERKGKGEKLFVNFNYTKTLEFYTNRNFRTKNNLINIHGELVNLSNPIIFGYGDEMDPNYEKIENLNNNEFLKNIKSFGYFQSSNYQDIIRFIDSENFTVKILGHSCGLSDRILLNTIFEHPNCKAIKIYYYQKSETENDYFEKTQEISRHFKASGKGNMRTKIVPFEKCQPLLPYKL